MGLGKIITDSQLTDTRLPPPKGSITYEDGRTPDWRGRDIVRLSLTLLDQGALQDRMVLWSLYDALRRAKIQAGPEYQKKGPTLRVMSRARSSRRDPVAPRLKPPAHFAKNNKSRRGQTIHRTAANG